MLVLYLLLFLQIPASPPTGWEQVGITTILVTVIGGLVWIYNKKCKECEDERKRADANDQKYVDVLIADIQERKDRDRTIELLTGVIRENHQGDPKGESKGREG